MSNVIPFPESVKTDKPFGGCPECGGCSSIFYCGLAGWGTCDTHNVKWRINHNFSFRASGEKTDGGKHHSAASIVGLREVVPIYPRPTTEVAAENARARREAAAQAEAVPIVRQLRKLSLEYADCAEFADSMNAAVAVILAQSSLRVDCGGEWLSTNFAGKLVVSGDMIDAFYGIGPVVT